MDHGVDGLPTSHIYSKTYVEAVHRHALLCGRLLTSNQSAASAVLDISYAWTAAIILQLAQLVPDVLRTVNGDMGNESARNCGNCCRVWCRHREIAAQPRPYADKFPYTATFANPQLF